VATYALRDLPNHILTNHEISHSRENLGALFAMVVELIDEACEIQAADQKMGISLTECLRGRRSKLAYHWNGGQLAAWRPSSSVGKIPEADLGPRIERQDYNPGSRAFGK
jgi:hypothetical protein